MRKFFLFVFAFIFITGNNIAYPFNRIVIDAEGRKVKIPQKLERVIVLTAVCLEVIYICGEIDKVVGITKGVFNNPVYKEIIKGLEDIPIVAQTEQDVNIEKLLALNPQLVIGLSYSHPFGLSKEFIEKVENFGIPVFLINVKSLDQNYYTISLLGKIFNQEKKAQELVNYMKRIVQKVQKEVQKIPEEKRVKVLTISGDKPTYVGGGYWGKQDIKVLAGGINVAEEIKEFFAVVSVEKIISWNPDVILISHLAKYSVEDILKNPQFKDIQAVKNKRVYKNPYQIGGLFTPRVVLLLAWTAKKLYPEIKLDWLKIADEFFKKFYGISYYGERE